jgi:predicted extracellular nuclease
MGRCDRRGETQPQHAACRHHVVSSTEAARSRLPPQTIGNSRLASVDRNPTAGSRRGGVRPQEIACDSTSSAVAFSNAPNPRPDTAAVAAATGARFRIVSANVLNFFTMLGSRGAATATELDHQRTKIVAELSRAGGDIIGLSELQNFENGDTNGGTYTNAAIADLTAALATATGRNYHYLDTINPLALAPGNGVADNGTDAIRSGMIYDAPRHTGQPSAVMRERSEPSNARKTFQPAGGIHRAADLHVIVNHFDRRIGLPVGNDVYQGTATGGSLDGEQRAGGSMGTRRSIRQVHRGDTC